MKRSKKQEDEEKSHKKYLNAETLTDRKISKSPK